MFSAASVCLCVCVFICVYVCVFVCQHDNFRMSKHRMMKLGVGVLYKNRGRVRILGVIVPLGAHPQNVASGYDVGKSAQAVCCLQCRRYNAFCCFRGAEICYCCVKSLWDSVWVWHADDGQVLMLRNISRHCSDMFECIADNGVAPSVSRRMRVSVQCSSIFTSTCIMYS